MLLANILQVQTEYRYGCEQIKDDPWFANIEWEAIYRKEVEAPEMPWIRKSVTKLNVAEEFAEIELEDISEEIYVDEFKDF